MVAAGTADRAIGVIGRIHAEAGIRQKSPVRYRMFADDHGGVADIDLMTDDTGVLTPGLGVRGRPGIGFVTQPHMLEGNIVTRVDGVIVEIQQRAGRHETTVLLIVAICDAQGQPGNGRTRITAIVGQEPKIGPVAVAVDVDRGVRRECSPEDGFLVRLRRAAAEPVTRFPHIRIVGIQADIVKALIVDDLHSRVVGCLKIGLGVRKGVVSPGKIGPGQHREGGGLRSTAIFPGAAGDVRIGAAGIRQVIYRKREITDDDLVEILHGAALRRKLSACRLHGIQHHPTELFHYPPVI